MSGYSSRLRSLERSLKPPRSLRAKARALTVMRLEGSAGVQTKRQKAHLPKDLEDQIAVIRGRAIGKPSRGLLQLEERLLRTNKVEPASQVIQRNEHSAAPAAAASGSPARAQAASIASRAFGGGYNVESFEDTSAVISPNALPPVYSESNLPALITPIKFGSGTPSAIPGAPVVQVAPSAGPGAKTFSVSEPYGRNAREHALSSDQRAVAENFERDIAVMLGTQPVVTAPEDNQWNQAMLDATRTATQPPAPAPVAKAPEPSTVPKPHAHEVFNQMGLAMNYANSFDLGTMDMSARFDRFDNELALAPQKGPQASTQTPVHALALDDFDVVADLAEISSAQSASSPIAVTPPTAEKPPAIEKPPAVENPGQVSGAPSGSTPAVGIPPSEISVPPSEISAPPSEISSPPSAPMPAVEKPKEPTTNPEQATPPAT